MPSSPNKNLNSLGNTIIVQKYGGATLADPAKIKQVAARLARLSKSGQKVIVVVSAMGQSTNQLIELAPVSYTHLTLPTIYSV